MDLERLSQEIDWIIFDIGGVLVEVDFEQTITAISEKGAIPSDRAKKLLLGDRENNYAQSIAHRFSIGKLETDDYLMEMIDALDYNVDADDLLAMRQKELRAVHEPVVEKLPALAFRYRLACFSNSNPIHWDYMLKNYTFFDHFSVAMGSHLAGACKPDLKAYLHMGIQLQSDFATCLLIDDRIENLVAANMVGMKTLHCDEPRQLAAKLHDLIR